MGTTDNSIGGGTFHEAVVMARDAHLHYHSAAVAHTPRMSVPSVRHYVNNAELFTRMDTIWDGCRSEDIPTRMLLTGVPGVGATAAVRRWLHLHRADFPGIQLHAVLGRDSSGRPVDPVAVLEDWLRILGVPKDDRPSDPDALAAFFRSWTSSGPVVVFIDGALTAAQVAPLLPGSDQSVVLITSHSRLPGLVSRFDVDVLPVKPLDDLHSDELLTRVGRLPSGTRTARQWVVQACGGIPLAVRIVGAHLAALGPEALHDLALRFDDRRTRWEAMDMSDDASLSGMLDLAVGDLETEIARAYRLLGLLPIASGDLGVVQELFAADASTTRRALRALGAANLLEQEDGDSFSMSRLVHDHAWRHVQDDEPAQSREDALDRVVRYYVDRAESAEAALSGRWRYDPMGTYRTYARPPATDQRATTRALARQSAGLFAAVDLAASSGRHALAWRLCQGLWTFCLRGGHHADWIKALNTGLASALETGDLIAMARMHYELGFAHLDRFSAAEDDARHADDHLRAALRLARPPEPQRTEGHHRTESSVLEGLGLLELKQGRAQEAVALFLQALTALDPVHHPRGRALLTYHRGRALTALGRHEDAARALLDARRQFDAFGDRYNEAKALFQYAQDRRAAGELDRAVEALDEASPIMRVHGPAYQQAGLLLLRGDVHHEQGHAERAVSDWSAARELYASERSTRVAEAETRLARGAAGSGLGDEE
ncbi:hypothetical protein QMK19_27930 [Streptomyces sp. H10-C2]|uniref:hypothetical protein n=1 Tax=unclassified Streptomyces TaxID=2593676 RepID=UPI0024BA76EA|nr:MULTISPECIES: hypothetical protein [unclassified Streptomyces]MDJ0343940.1 hypothetical protein [Streptomyces sp. PH10-H1]MDJ0373381.1 hypothetical protein [Streptomyces sp. H10-C2]